MLILNNFSVLCIWLQEKERVKLEEGEIEKIEEIKKVSIAEEEDAAEHNEGAVQNVLGCHSRQI
jgi:hypothetical protein